MSGAIDSEKNMPNVSRTVWNRWMTFITTIHGWLEIKVMEKDIMFVLVGMFL